MMQRNQRILLILAALGVLTMSLWMLSMLGERERGLDGGELVDVASSSAIDNPVLPPSPGLELQDLAPGGEHLGDDTPIDHDQVVIGRVVSPARYPIGRASVSAWALLDEVDDGRASFSSLGASVEESELVACTLTEMDGKFTLGLNGSSLFELVVGSESAMVQVLRLPRFEGTYDVGDIVIENSWSISGRVVTVDGAPVGGASVSIKHNLGNPASGRLWRIATSDPDGEFFASGLAAGWNDLLVEAEGFHDSSIAFDLLPEEDIPFLRCELRRPSAIHGMVYAPADFDLSNLTVWASRRFFDEVWDSIQSVNLTKYSGEVASDGSFSVEGMPEAPVGAYSIGVTDKLRPGIRLATPAIVGAPSEGAVLRILDDVTEIMITARLQSGEMVESFDSSVRLGFEGGGSTETESMLVSGRAGRIATVVGLSAAVYASVHATADGLISGRVDFDPGLWEAGVIEVEVELVNPRKVSILAIDGINGLPVRNAHIQFSGVIIPSPEHPMHRSGFTDNDGMLELSLSPNANYLVSAECDGYQALEGLSYGPLSVSQESGELTLKLTPAGGLSVLAVAASGAEIPHAKLDLFELAGLGGAENTRRIVCDAEGQGKALDLAPGRYRVFPYPKAATNSGRVVDIRAGSVSECRIVFDATCNLTVETRLNGVPMHDTRLRVLGPKGDFDDDSHLQEFYRTTSSAGTAVFEELPIGEYNVQVWYPRVGVSVERVQGLFGADKQLVVDEGCGTIEVLLVGSQGEPLDAGLVGLVPSWMVSRIVSEMLRNERFPQWAGRDIVWKPKWTNSAGLVELRAQPNSDLYLFALDSNRTQMHLSRLTESSTLVEAQLVKLATIVPAFEGTMNAPYIAQMKLRANLLGFPLVSWHGVDSRFDANPLLVPAGDWSLELVRGFPTNLGLQTEQFEHSVSPGEEWSPLLVLE